MFKNGPPGWLNLLESMTWKLKPQSNQKFSGKGIFLLHTLDSKNPLSLKADYSWVNQGQYNKR